MALQATGDLDKRERLELYQLQLNTFKEHFNYQEEPKKKTTVTTFSFQNARRDVADENYNGNAPQERSGSTCGVFNGKLAKLSDQLQVNPLKQFSEKNETFPTFKFPGEGAEKYDNATTQQDSCSGNDMKHSIPQKETEKVLKVEKDLVVETVEDLDSWGAFL
jgi:hypothetical protein